MLWSPKPPEACFYVLVLHATLYNTCSIVTHRSAGYTTIMLLYQRVFRGLGQLIALLEGFPRTKHVLHVYHMAPWSNGGKNRLPIQTQRTAFESIASSQLL